MAGELKKALEGVQARLAHYERFRNYYDGRHPIAFASDKWRNAFGQILCKFADNLCPTVVDAVADRLEVVGFELAAMGDLDFALIEDTDDQGLAEELETHREEMTNLVKKVWRDNRMDHQAGQVHQDALKLGDAYVLVWPDASGYPIIYPQQTEQIAVRYNPEDPRQVVWAAKAWVQEDGRLRLTLYFPDRLEKWVTRRKVEGHTLPDDPNAFEQFTVPGEPWPLTNPYGRVPIFHFANNAPVGCYGRSELKDVLPLQDALNKSNLDLLVAMEFNALPQRWMTGFEPEIDELTGKAKMPFIPGVDRLWAVASGEVKFGEFPASDLEHFLAVNDGFRVEIARVSGTPLHYFHLLTGNPPSGEALKTLEARLIKKVRDRQTAFGNAWEDVVAFCLAILGHPGASLSTRWVDPAPRSEKEHTETLLNKVELGVSKQQAMRELDYTDEQIEQMEREKEEAALNAASIQATTFERGAAGPPGAPAGATTGAPAPMDAPA